MSDEPILWTCGNCGREYPLSSDGVTFGFCQECVSESEEPELDEQTGEIY